MHALLCFSPLCLAHERLPKHIKFTMQLFQTYKTKLFKSWQSNCTIIGSNIFMKYTETYIKIVFLLILFLVQGGEDYLKKLPSYWGPTDGSVYRKIPMDITKTELRKRVKTFAAAGLTVLKVIMVEFQIFKRYIFWWTIPSLWLVSKY